MGDKTRRGARAMTALALAGLLSTVTGGVLMFTGGTATADPTPVPCVPAEAYTETTTVPAVQPPDDRAWRVVETIVVEDEAAYDEVVHVDWKNWVWHPTSGWDEPADGLGPYFPDTDHEGGWWSSNEGNHTGHPQPGTPGVNERGNYYRSNESSGKGDWFHWEEITETVHHDAVTHLEYLYALDHPAVVCETTTPPTTTPPTTTPPTTTPPTETTPPTTTPPTTTQPTETTQPPEVLPTTGTTTSTPTEEATQETEAPEVLGEQATGNPGQQEAQLPTAVDAGQGWTMTQMLGAALAAMGLVMLAGAAATPRAVRRT